MLYALCAALSLALLGLDQWVKHYVTVNIPLGDAQPFLPGLVELRTVHNYGAAWSSFSGMRWLLVAVTSVIVIAVAVVLLRRIVRHPLGVAAWGTSSTGCGWGTWWTCSTWSSGPPTRCSTWRTSAWCAAPCWR